MNKENISESSKINPKEVYEIVEMIVEDAGYGLEKASSSDLKGGFGLEVNGELFVLEAEVSQGIILKFSTYCMERVSGERFGIAYSCVNNANAGVKIGRFFMSNEGVLVFRVSYLVLEPEPDIEMIERLFQISLAAAAELIPLIKLAIDIIEERDEEQEGVEGELASSLLN